MLRRTPVAIWRRAYVLVFGVFFLCLSFLLFTQPVQAQSIGWRHAQGGTITKQYFLFATLDENQQGNANANIHRCDRNGTSISNCQVIVSGRFGHANVLEHHWGTNYFWILDNSGSWCYSLGGNKADSSNCGKKTPNKYPASGGRTSQGRAIYGDYYLKAYGSTRSSSRIAVMQKKNGDWKTIKNLDFSTKVYQEEIEDVAVDGDTGEIYYTMSGCFSEACWSSYDQEVRLYKWSGYKLPTADKNTPSKKKSSSTDSGSSAKNKSDSSGSSSGSSKKSGNSDDKKSPVKAEPDKEAECATILKVFCENAETDGQQTVTDIIKFVISIMTVGIVVLATVGIIICGYLIMTARDNAEQITKAKKRILEIVIGVVMWVLISALTTLLLPTKNSEVEEAINGTVSNSKIK